MNKGLKLRFCSECNKKRFCIKVPIPNYNYRFTCSKGHTWTIVGVTAERVIAAMQEVISEEKLKSLFERDDIFYKMLEKK